MQTNDAKQYGLNPNCFEKTKRSVGHFSFFLPQMSKRRTSALLPITFSGLATVAIERWTSALAGYFAKHVLCVCVAVI